MKRCALLVALLFATIVLFGCKSATTDTDNTVLYEVYTNAGFFTSEATSMFNLLEFKRSEAQATADIQIAGATYHFAYSSSAELPLSDFIVDVYNLENAKRGKVLVDITTGKIVEYVGIPYNGPMTQESEFVAFIANIVGSDYDLSTYTYSTGTRYFEFSEGGVSSTFEDGFRVCSENEELRGYSFFFTKKECGVRTDAHISAEFWIDSEGDTFFDLEVYDSAFNDTQVNQVISQISNIEKEVETYIRSVLKEAYTFQSMEISDMKLFSKDGVPYVCATVQLVLLSDDEASEHNIEVKTVTRVNAYTTDSSALTLPDQ